jgi:hypothetical protein
MSCIALRVLYDAVTLSTIRRRRQYKKLRQLVESWLREDEEDERKSKE